MAAEELDLEDGKKKKESRVNRMVVYEDGKLWFHKKGNLITLGITLSGLDEIGEVESIHLPSDGDDFDKDES